MSLSDILNGNTEILNLEKEYPTTSSVPPGYCTECEGILFLNVFFNEKTNLLPYIVNNVLMIFV